MSEPEPLADLIERAHEKLSAACQRGRLRMSVPARPDDDDDLVISTALQKARERIEELKATKDANALLEEIQRNKKRIAELEAERDAREAQLAEMRREIAAMRDRERIEELKAQLANRDETIASLEERVGDLSYSQTKARERIATLETALHDIRHTTELLGEFATRADELAAMILRRIAATDPPEVEVPPLEQEGA